MNKLPQLYHGIGGNLRGKVASFVVPTFKQSEDPMMFVNHIARVYDRSVKDHRQDKLAEYNYPKFAKRLNERQPPCEERTLIRKNEFRKRDRAIVNSFCDFFMYTQQAYKPPKRGRK
jgi:hypothetical protein